MPAVGTHALSITPDQLASAGSYITHEWGGYGYRIERIESPTRRVSLFHVVASDGSRFIVAADCWGNCSVTDEKQDWQVLVVEMDSRARAA
jgi:hypothetical protein